MTEIKRIFELHQLAVSVVERYPRNRFIFESILNDEGKHLLGIAGLRGTGKSVILKQVALKRTDSIFISLDTLGEIDLFDLIKDLSKNYGIKLFLLDEVHFVKNIDEILKKVYDFLEVKVIFTSSISIGMFQSAYDLSRRVKMTTLYPFTFREFLYFQYDIELGPLSLNELIQKNWEANHLKFGFCFEEYLRGGNMPFSIDEPDIFPLLKNILQTIINKDIPKIAKLSIDELTLIEKMLSFIGKSEIDGINYSSISKNIGITKFKAQAYVELLQKAFVLHRILPKGTNVLKEPKILLAPPFRMLFKNYNECIGGLREDFFVEMLATAELKFNYLKSTRGKKTPDYLIENDNDEIIVELGGKGKGREQFKGIKGKKQLIFTHSNKFDSIKRPLFMAGFLK